MAEFDREKFLQSIKALVETLHGLGGDWIVASTPFGCAFGYSKVCLRRTKDKPSPVRAHIRSPCLPDEEVESLKREIRRLLRTMS